MKMNMEADSWIVQSSPFLLETFQSPELRVRGSVQRLKARPLLPDKSATRMCGCVCEIDFVGRLRKVTTYVVQTGDTGTDIANRFGVPLQALIAVNPQVGDPNLGGAAEGMTITHLSGPDHVRAVNGAVL
jgi:hypothetical protein